MNQSLILCSLSKFEKMPIKECDARKMIAEIAATSWNPRECIQGRELAASHRLEQVQRFRMLEEQKTWKREEAEFDRIEIMLKCMHSASMRASIRYLSILNCTTLDSLRPPRSTRLK